MKILSPIFVMLIAFTLSCQSQPTAEVLAPAAFQKHIQETPKGIVLDVRTPGEYDKGYISKALNVDYRNENFKAEVAKLDTAATYFVYCRSGGRSASAAGYMKSAGFSKVYDLKGGIIAWKKDKFFLIQKPLPADH